MPDWKFCATCNRLIDSQKDKYYKLQEYHGEHKVEDEVICTRCADILIGTLKGIATDEDSPVTTTN